eukprot:221388_1
MWTLILLVQTVVLITTSDTININKNGPIEYCNVDPNRWKFEPLSPYDIARVRSLKQVHILARHGARIISGSIKHIFPKSNQKFECHWKSVATRYYKNEKDWMSFKLNFVDNEQIVEGSCAVSSSLQAVIPQHRANAQMAKAFYIGDADYQLMTESELNDIAGQLTYYNQLTKTVDIPEIKIISANYERTITSATVFMSEFLDINTPEVAMELYTHDYQSDPYASNKDKSCPLFAEYIDAIGMESTQYTKLMQSEMVNATKQQWFEATGHAYSYNKGESAVLMYCGGLDVPLEYNHFLNVLNTSYRIREAILSNNETSSTSCTLAASPMLWLFATLIKNHIVFLRQTDMVEHAEETDMFENGSYYMSAERARLIYHSVHDTSILYMLEALGISNGREPMFAEMLTLEIYERSMNDPWYNIDIQQVTDELYENYLFRSTRKGKALAIFPECEEEYQYTHSSLCSLSVLMAAMDYGQNIKPWEKTCRSVTEQYFAKQKKKEKKKKHHKSKGSNSDLSFLWTFALGVSCGVAIMMFISK